MGKLNETDIPIVVSFLKEGQKFSEIAETLEVSDPTLRRFMQENDLYKYSTNQRSIKISKSLSTKSNNDDDNTLKSMIEDVMDHANDLYDEDVNFLEDLLKKGTSIGKIAKMYHRGTGTVRKYLKKIGLYQKYCSENKFDNKSRVRQMQRERKAKEEKSENIIVRPKYGKTIVSENTLPVSVGVQSIEKEKEKPVNNDIVKNDNIQEENNTNIVRQLTIEDLQNNGCFVNDVVLDYINKNIKTISLQAKLESITNTMMDSLINIFSEEELKDGNIKVEIKRTLVKLVEELL